MSMRQCQDSFLKFLDDNLALTIHPIRFDTNRPDSSELEIGAVNVNFLDAFYHAHISGMQVSIDVLDENELTCIDNTHLVWLLLSKRFFTEKKDYTVPLAPVNVGTNLYWDNDAVRFRAVTSDFYAHYSCLMSLHQNIALS